MNAAGDILLSAETHRLDGLEWCKELHGVVWVADNVRQDGKELVKVFHGGDVKELVLGGHMEQGMERGRACKVEQLYAASHGCDEAQGGEVVV